MSSSLMSFFNIVIISTCLFLGTSLFAYILGSDTPWLIGLAALMGYGIIMAIIIIMGLVIICFACICCPSNIKYSNSDDDSLDLCGAGCCLLLCSALFGLIGTAILFPDQLGLGVGAAALGGAMTGGLLLLTGLVLIIILTCCGVTLHLLGGTLNNKQFLPDDRQSSHNLTTFDPVPPPLNFSHHENNGNNIFAQPDMISTYNTSGIETQV